MKTTTICDCHKHGFAGRLTGFHIALVAVLVAAAFVSGCSVNIEHSTPHEPRQGIDEQQAPIDFNPPIEMSYFSGQQALLRRGGVLETDLKYLATEKSAHANFRILDIQSDHVFVDRSGVSEQLSVIIKRIHKDAVKTLGEFSESQRLEFQHYLLEVDRACVMVIKYTGADGAGDVTAGGVPRGSIAMLADFCEAGTEQLTAQRRQQWIDSFQYRQN